MATNSKIEWTDATWNVITGCSPVSPGCQNCYAMQLAGTRLKNHSSRASLTKEVNGKHVWTGEVRFNQEWLDQPLRWKKPRKIFVCAHGDLFHKNVPDEWLDKVFAVMTLCPHHTFQVLTKRPERMQSYMTPVRPLPNVWFGVTVENQEIADKRIPLLLRTPAEKRFVSIEPILGRVDLERIVLKKSDAPEKGKPDVSMNALKGWYGGMQDWPFSDAPAIDWVIVGGESGPNARPIHPDWARSIRDQCAAAGVPFMFKQWGRFKYTGLDDPEFKFVTVDKAAGRMLDGCEHMEFPG